MPIANKSHPTTNTYKTKAKNKNRHRLFDLIEAHIQKYMRPFENIDEIYLRKSYAYICLHLTNENTRTHTIRNSLLLFYYQSI